MGAEYTTDVESEIERVTKHFTEVTVKLAIVLTRAPEEDKAFQNDLEEAGAALSQYYAEKGRMKSFRRKAIRFTSRKEN